MTRTTKRGRSEKTRQEERERAMQRKHMEEKAWNKVDRRSMQSEDRYYKAQRQRVNQKYVNLYGSTTSSAN